MKPFTVGVADRFGNQLSYAGCDSGLAKSRTGDLRGSKRSVNTAATDLGHSDEGRLTISHARIRRKGLEVDR
jgi:hypothetical protein